MAITSITAPSLATGVHVIVTNVSGGVNWSMRGRVKRRMTKLCQGIDNGIETETIRRMQPLLLLSYGAPERQDDVVPFLNRLFSGKNVSAERIAAAVQKYASYAEKTGHYSPLNAECRKLIDGIRQIEPDLPIYWGNLFWHPLLVDTVAKMVQDGVKHAMCFATSAFDSPSGNQRYADALETARQTVGANAPILEKLPLPFDHPFFIEAQADRLLETLRINVTAPPGGKNAPYILFTAHSIPVADAAQCHYVEQLQSTCRKVIRQCLLHRDITTIPWELVYQSQSRNRGGNAAEHWLGPDIRERLRMLATEGCRSVIVSPIGFLCENMETEYDLDIEVGECCSDLGIAFYRTKAVGATPLICRLVQQLLQQPEFTG